jgi:hypothetical protein
MAVRHSEYDRIAGDFYETPSWVWLALWDVEPWARDAWDCAPDPLIADFDFLAMESLPTADLSSNPPYGRLAEKFIRHALRLTSPHAGRVAMLLPVTYDCAQTRVDLFGQPFARKWIITRRISWANLTHVACPSSNHAWYVWQHGYTGLPTMGWL